MDRTVVNLLCLLVGGGGLLAFLADYSVPELRKTYWGENPFKVKAEAIRGVMAWLFGALALLVVSVQVAAEIAGDVLAARLHSTWTYLGISIGGSVLSAVLVRFLAWFGRVLAKPRWLPDVIDAQRSSYDNAAFVVEHDGFTEEELANEEHTADDSRREANLNRAETRVSVIEKLLEIDGSGQQLGERVRRLAPYFQDPNS